MSYRKVELKGKNPVQVQSVDSSIPAQTGGEFNDNLIKIIENIVDRVLDNKNDVEKTSPIIKYIKKKASNKIKVIDKKPFKWIQ